MATTMKRLTFVVTPEMEVLLTRFKKKKPADQCREAG